MCTHELSQGLISIVLWRYECSWVLMSSHDLKVPYSWLLLSSHECSLLHGTKLMSVNGCSWVLIGNQEHSWLLLAAYECSWVLMGAHECSWLLMSTLEQPWTLLSLAPWSNEHSLELKSNHEHGTIGSWALISTHEHSWHHSTILMSARESSRAHMSAYESLWALMRSHECWTASLENKQKMLTFKITSSWYFANILVHISPNNKKFDIFKIYIKWAVEKCPRWNF